MSQNQPPGCLAFFLAGIAYLILSFFSRLQLSPVVWHTLALLVIPTLAALPLRGETPPVRAAFWAVLWAMVFYTSINLTRIRAGIASGDTGGNLLASLVLCVVYGTLAGAVAALVVWLRTPKRRVQGEE